MLPDSTRAPLAQSGLARVAVERTALGACFGYPLWLLETFVDPRHFHGTLYRAANWTYVGDTRGFPRSREGDSATAETPKRMGRGPHSDCARAVSLPLAQATLFGTLAHPVPRSAHPYRSARPGPGVGGMECAVRP